MNELEPLPPELAQLRDQLPQPATSAAMNARVWARVAASGAPWAVAPTAASLPRLGTLGLPLALAAFVGGGVAGVVLERAVLAPRVEQPAAPRPTAVEVPLRVPAPLPVPLPAPAPVPPPVVRPRVPTAPPAVAMNPVAAPSEIGRAHV